MADGIVSRSTFLGTFLAPSLMWSNIDLRTTTRWRYVIDPLFARPHHTHVPANVVGTKVALSPVSLTKKTRAVASFEPAAVKLSKHNRGENEKKHTLCSRR